MFVHNNINMESVIKSNINIICVCNNICSVKESFSVYEKHFCSLTCLNKFKSSENEKTLKKSTNIINRIPTCDYGGPSCF